MVQPPSTTSAWPVVKVEASDARYSNAPTNSQGLPIRPKTVRALSRCRNGSSGATLLTESCSVFENGPGRMAFALTPNGPQNEAVYLVNASSAAFDAL